MGTSCHYSLCILYDRAKVEAAQADQGQSWAERAKVRMIWCDSRQSTHFRALGTVWSVAGRLRSGDFEVNLDGSSSFCGPRAMRSVAEGLKSGDFEGNLDGSSPFGGPRAMRSEVSPEK